MKTTLACMLMSLLAGAAAAAPDGPTLLLGNGQDGPPTNSITAFMYFVPLISPEPLSIVTGPGSTQSARVRPATPRVSGNSFEAICEIEFSGSGWQKSIFDLTYEIHRHAQELMDGGTLPRQLKSIAMEGSGEATMEVEGTVNDGAWTVSEVRLRFNAHGKSSPVTIEMCDIKYLNGDFRQVNGLVAKVDTLTFRRQTGTPKMEVTVASLKEKTAGDSLWQSLKGKVEGEAVNWFLPPLPVEEIGNRAMLDFGLALINGSPTFTFPRAKNLKPVDQTADP
ncbi:MAG TPA: hypothetical protein VMR33_22750 [Candidatus Baltobacteraceae bacterium]|nr:hypothetical protein [Candidatus Baltobacteraceae bacterium]